MKTKVNTKDVEKLVEKYDNLKKKNKLDLSADEDLSIAIMNLISIEEHLFFSGNKTGDKTYFELLKEVRNMRSELLKKIIKKYEGEVWCISKHLLASSYRLLEYGTKLQNMNKNDEAYKIFEQAYGLYSLFWALNLGKIKVKDIDSST